MKKLLAILLAVAMILPCFAVTTAAVTPGTQPTSWSLNTANSSSGVTYDDTTKTITGGSWKRALLVPNSVDGGWTGIESITIDFGKSIQIGETSVVYSGAEMVKVGAWTTQKELTFAVDPTKTVVGIYYQFAENVTEHGFVVSFTYAEVQPEPPIQPTWTAGNECTYKDGVLTSPKAWRTTTLTPSGEIEGEWTGVQSIAFDFGTGFAVGGTFEILYSDGTSLAVGHSWETLTGITVDVDSTKTIAGIKVQITNDTPNTFGITFNYVPGQEPKPREPVTAVLGGKTALGFRYVNEQYHALVIRIPVPTTPVGLIKLLVMPHTYGETGVCTICGAVEVVEVPADEVVE